MRLPLPGGSSKLGGGWTKKSERYMSPIVWPTNNAEFEPQNVPGRDSAIAEGEVVIGTVRIITSASPKVHDARIHDSTVDNTWGLKLR